MPDILHARLHAVGAAANGHLLHENGVRARARTARGEREMTGPQFEAAERLAEEGLDFFLALLQVDEAPAHAIGYAIFPAPTLARALCQHSWYSVSLLPRRERLGSHPR